MKTARLKEGKLQIKAPAENYTPVTAHAATVQALSMKGRGVICVALTPNTELQSLHPKLESLSGVAFTSGELLCLFCCLVALCDVIMACI